MDANQPISNETFPHALLQKIRARGLYCWTCLPQVTHFTLLCERLNKLGPFPCMALSADTDGAQSWVELTTSVPIRTRELHLTVNLTGSHWKVGQSINEPLTAEQQELARNLVSPIDRAFTTSVNLFFIPIYQWGAHRLYSALYGCARPFLHAFQTDRNMRPRSTVRCLQFNFKNLPLPWSDPPRTTTDPPLDLRAHGAETIWFVWSTTPAKTKKLEPNGFCEFLDALGSATVHLRITNDPDKAYTRTQLERQRCKPKIRPTPSGDNGPHQFWTTIRATPRPPETFLPPSHPEHGGKRKREDPASPTMNNVGGGNRSRRISGSTNN